MRHTRISSQLMRWALPALLIAYVTLHRLGQTYGSTCHERHAPMPGDGIVPILPADFVMSRDMLQGVKRRAEQLRRTRASA
jgi:hypothetical protein